jgi:hypothetical protein
MLVLVAMLPIISSSIDPAFGWMIWVFSVLLPTMSIAAGPAAMAADDIHSRAKIRINAMVISLKINPFPYDKSTIAWVG